MLGIFNSNFASLLWAFLYVLHKKWKRTKVEFSYQDLGIKVVFSKNCQKSPNFHIFVLIYIVKFELWLEIPAAPYEHPYSQIHNGAPELEKIEAASRHNITRQKLTKEIVFHTNVKSEMFFAFKLSL